MYVPRYRYNSVLHELFGVNKERLEIICQTNLDRKDGDELRCVNNEHGILPNNFITS